MTPTKIDVSGIKTEKQYTVTVPGVPYDQLAGEFELDLFFFLPRVIQDVLEAKDQEMSTLMLARQMGIDREKYEVLQSAAIKWINATPEHRKGADIRGAILDSIDTQIEFAKGQIKYLTEDRKKAFEFLEECKVRCAEAKEMYEGNELAKEEALIMSKVGPEQYDLMNLKIDAHQKLLATWSQRIREWEAERAKASGILVQRRELVSNAAHELLATLYNIEKYRTEQIQSGETPFEIRPDPWIEPPDNDIAQDETVESIL